MKGLTIICLAALTLLISGCAKKVEIQKEYVYIKQQIPAQFLTKEMVHSREIKTQTDAANLILDLYAALESCNLKLEKIKELNE